MNKKWMLEWSQKQRSFHIQLLDDALETNRDSFNANRSTDWVPLFIGSYAECEAVARHNEKKLLRGGEKEKWTH